MKLQKNRAKIEKYGRKCNFYSILRFFTVFCTNAESMKWKCLEAN